MKQMEERAFQEAEKINTIRFADIYLFPPDGIYVSSDVKNRRQLLTRLIHLASPAPHDDVPSEPADKGAEALRVMSALSSYYPFPTIIRMTLKGYAMNVEEPDPVRFVNLQELHQWIVDIEEVAGRAGWLHETDIRWAKLQEILSAFSE
jgi:hypothetical protein